MPDWCLTVLRRTEGLTLPKALVASVLILAVASMIFAVCHPDDWGYLLLMLPLALAPTLAWGAAFCCAAATEPVHNCTSCGGTAPMQLRAQVARWKQLLT